MAIPAVPVIDDLPPAPTRNDGAADFTPKSDAMIGALQPLVVQVNITTQWMNGRLTDAQAAQAAAAASATAAADSATLAGQKVGLAADQVGLAITARQGAETALASTQVVAASVQSAAGTPSLIGRGGQALCAKIDETGVEFKALGQAIGDILVTARTPDATYLPANGSAYLQATWPELFAVIGAAVKTAPVTKLADPTSLPAGTGSGVAFSTDGVYMAVAHTTSPFVTIYKRSGDVFTKLPNPASIPPSQGNGVAFSTDGTYLAVAHAFSPYITIYKRSGDVFTKLADPATLPTSVGNGVAFSADGTYLAVAHTTSPFVTIYKRSGEVFTKLANPATLPANNAYGVAFSTDGVYMAVAHNITPFIALYKRAGDVFTKLPNPVSLQPSDSYAVALYQSGATYMGDFMAIAHSGTPYVTIYRDGYPFDPYTQFQLPAGTANGTTPQPNIDTALPIPKLTPYIKAKVNP